MNRAVGARLGFFADLSWGGAPGWYELTPLASPGAFNGKCPGRRLTSALLWPGSAMLAAFDLKLGERVHQGRAYQGRFLVVEFFRQARLGAFARFLGLGFVDLLGANRHV